MNINYVNSFNENYNITITYAPIYIIDTNALLEGHIGTYDGTDPNPVMKDTDGNTVYADASFI